MIYLRSVLFLWISGNFNEISVPPKFDQSRTRRGWISRILPQNASNHLKIALQNLSGLIYEWWNMIYVRSVLFLWISGNFKGISVPPKFDQSRTRRGWISRILAQHASNHLKIALQNSSGSIFEWWNMIYVRSVLFLLVHPLNLTKAEPVGAGFQGFWLKMPLTISKLHFKIHQDQYSNGETWFTCAQYYFYEYLAILMKLVYPLNLTKV